MIDEIAFDLRSAGGSPTGVGRYVLCVVQALAAERPDLRLRAYVRDDVPELPASVRTVRIRSRGILWHARTWRHLRRHPARVYCSTSLLIPSLGRLVGSPCMPIVLDLISFMFPEYQTVRTRLFERIFMGRVARLHPLIAESETTRRDIERLLPGSRAAVVPPWVSIPEHERSDPRALERLGVPIPFAVYLGTVEPRKNVLVAARAVAELRRSGSDLRLVVVGGRGWIDDDAAHQLAEFEEQGVIVRTGYVPDSDRDAILDSATCLVLPSMYEGFGLPLLEAMGRALPCLTSTAPSLVEVGGDAVIAIDPNDVSGWADALRRVAVDERTRARLSESGRDRFATFNPARTARTFVEALGQLGGGRPA